MTRRIQNPVDLMLRIARTPDGLRITSPQIPNFAAIARGPVPIAQAVDAALRELDCDTYAARRGQPSDRALWDAACEKLNAPSAPKALAASGVELRPEDVTVDWHDGQARRDSGAVMRPMAVNGARHDPSDWTDLGNGFWSSPGGHRYRQESRQVQLIIAKRAAPATVAVTPSLFDQATG